MAEAVSAASLEHFARLPLKRRFGMGWWAGVVFCSAGSLLLLVALILPVADGLGIWGNNVPFVWGVDLAGYFWWIGIANGAALLASLLVLWQAPLRTAASRLAETIGVAAALCAALFPVVHLGDPLLAYWMAPYPTHTGLWPQPMSALTWDFWGIVSHLITLTLLWYIGLIPDLALLRDQARGRWAARLYGLFALGWRGSSRQWVLQHRAHRMAALSVIPFLFVMQTIVALELATTIVPGWHDTGLPVRNVISGFAAGLGLVLCFAALLGGIFHSDLPDDRDPVERLAKLVLATALVSAFVVALTTTIEWLGPDGSDSVASWATGGGAWVVWLSLLLSKLLPQLLWWRRFRNSRWSAGLIGLGVAVGVWLDFFAVMTLPLADDRLIDPAEIYDPSWAEAALMVGTLAFFGLLMLLAVRTIPLVSAHRPEPGESK